jgi:polyisoprenoid-binding protein YceI
MSFRVQAIAAALFVLAVVRLAAAADLRAGTLELDPSKTRIEFHVAGALHAVHGTFKLNHAVINADPRTGAATGLIEIDAASGESGLGARDNRMKDSILESQKYPHITFTPEHLYARMEPDGAFHASLQGVMSVHGSAHEMILDTAGQLSDGAVVATCHFSIPYVEWGMKDPSLLLLTVAKQVDIDVAATGRVVWAGEPARE